MSIDTFGCLGNKMITADGHYFDLANPRPQDVFICDIAIALGNICRFGGCLPDPHWYSVAEHSCHAADLAKELGYDKGVQRCCLLHDAAEAYIGDIVKPLKNMLPELRTIEERVEAAIWKALYVDWTVEAIDAVKWIDRMLLKAEKMALFPLDQMEWTGFEDVETVWLNFFGQNDVPRDEFLKRYCKV